MRAPVIDSGRSITRADLPPRLIDGWFSGTKFVLSNM